jgi:hypothetical protein
VDADLVTILATARAELRRFAGVLAASFLVACAPASPPLPADLITPGCSAVLTGAISNTFDSCRVFAEEYGGGGGVAATTFSISFVTRDVRMELDVILKGVLQPGTYLPAQGAQGGQVESFAGPTWSRPSPDSPTIVITAAVPIKTTSGGPSHQTEFSVHGNAIATYVSDNGTSGTVTANFTF